MPRLPMYQVAAVTFDSSSTLYTYNLDFLAKVGDRVLVDSPRTGLTAVTVHEISSQPNRCSKSLIHPNDLAKVQLERANRERRFEIVKRLNQLQHEEEQRARFTALARRVPEARKLLAELKKLG
jgi:hypothetical protein